MIKQQTRLRSQWGTSCTCSCNNVSMQSQRRLNARLNQAAGLLQQLRRPSRCLEVCLNAVFQSMSEAAAGLLLQLQHQSLCPRGCLNAVLAMPQNILLQPTG